MTHQLNLPYIVQSNYTDALLNDSRIAHWFAHNPFFHPSSKLSAFPYGINPERGKLESYMEAIKSYKESSVTINIAHNGTRYEYPFKLSEPVIANLFFTVENHISREKLPLNKTRPQNYYAELAKYKYVISPHGDRPDCYRHWEAIGLGVIPIANINASLFNPFSLRDSHFLHRIFHEHLHSTATSNKVITRSPEKPVIVNGTEIRAGGNMVFMEVEDIAFLINSYSHDGGALFKDFDKGWVPPQRYLTFVIFWACKVYMMKETFRRIQKLNCDKLTDLPPKTS
jgi:hypothetical protein